MSHPKRADPIFFAFVIVVALTLFILSFVSKANAQTYNLGDPHSYSADGVHFSVDGVLLSSPTVGYQQQQYRYVPPAPRVQPIWPQPQRQLLVPRYYEPWSPTPPPPTWSNEYSQRADTGLKLEQFYLSENASSVRFSIGGVPVSIRTNKWSGPSLCLGSFWGCY
jgi:hypothetical protein